MDNKNMIEQYEERLETARAYWSDAMHQYYEALTNPQSTKECLEGLNAYYLRASENLRRAFLSYRLA